jgi:hypothetical protein
MDIWEPDKLILFLAFVIPGFVSIKCYQLAFPGTQRATQDQLIDAVAYSSINYAILLPLILGVQHERWMTSPAAYIPFYLFVLLIAPVLWVALWKLIRTRDFFQRTAPHPIGLPWDFVFRQRKHYWMKVVLKDGTVIAGRYGANSFVSSAPSPAQLYLEEAWLLNDKGGFIRKKNDTEGVLIVSQDLSHIELRHYSLPGELHVQPQTAAP